jgi:hypothetical protein
MKYKGKMTNYHRLEKTKKISQLNNVGFGAKFWNSKLTLRNRSEILMRSVVLKMSSMLMY